MRIHALATDYDGTLAHAGCVSTDTRAALARVRESGRRLILVSGRELGDLMGVFPELSLFDMVIAENGAVLFDPSRQEVTELAEAPPQALVSELHRRHVPVAIGRIIIATGQPHEVEVLRAIRDLGLEWEVIFNKGAVMALPSGVNKASGLDAALERLQLSRHNLAGIGDAENDHSFLRICEVAVAVGNALPAIKERAGLVMRRYNGRGVVEFIDRFLLDDLAGAGDVFARYSIELGSRPSGAPLVLPAYDANVLIVGSSGAGKSTLSGVLVERLTDQGYQVCVVDPEGDHSTLEPLIVVGSTHARPALEEITSALERNPSGVVVNLVALSTADKVRFAADLLSRVFGFRGTHGRPRFILLDEAHHLLPAGQTLGAAVLPEDVEGVALVTLAADSLAASALDRVTHLFVVGEGAADQIRRFADARGLRRPEFRTPAETQLPELLEGEALMLLVSAGRIARPRLFRVAPRRFEHRRHVRKYTHGDIGPDQSFYFRGKDGKLNLRAYNVHAFAEMASGVDPETWMYHLQRGELSDWFEEKVKDPEVAQYIREIEQRAADLGPEQSRAEILRFIEARYTASA